jgi:heme/copper-type cytochrome/quinol oxidase subunit 2
MAEELGKVLIFLGIFLLVLGTLMVLLPKFNLPLGNLPGDIKIEKENFVFYFPLASSILVSVILTVVLNLIFLLLGRGR